MAAPPTKQKGQERKSKTVDLGSDVKHEPFRKISMRLQDKYRSEVIQQMRDKFGYKNVMQVPRIEKVVINIGVGEAVGNPKLLDTAYAELGHIAGQRPVITRARNSISNFKLREGVKIGTKVTLRRAHMWAFLDKLFSVVLPRIRDFRGLSNKAFDGRGNYAIGLKEQTIFPEIQYDKVERVRGMDINIVTTAKTDEEAAEFLKLLGCPIRTQ
jgi:large subunit ribosomal protein L5